VHEYGALIVGEGASFKPYMNRITTNQQPDWVGIRHPDDANLVKGQVHNHPAGTDDYFTQLESRYPSNADWDNARALVDAGKHNSNVVLYVLDPTGKVRAFPYSSFDVYRNITGAEKREGLQLPNSLGPGSCTDLEG